MQTTIIILCAVVGMLSVLCIVLMIMSSNLLTHVRNLRDTVNSNDEQSERRAELLRQYVENSGFQMETRMENLRVSVDQDLERVRTETVSQLEKLRVDDTAQMEKLRAENSAQLDRMRQTVDEKLQQGLDDRLSRSFSAVQKSLDEVFKGLGEMQGLAQGVGDLKKVLSNVKTRGIVGEIQLSSILEQILPKTQYYENVATVPASSERVEFAVKMPGDGNREVLLPIDAKFHGDSYAHLAEAYESGDKSAIAEARKQLIQAVKKSGKDIHDKYIQPPFTTDFGVMFLPFEGLYAEIVNLGVMEGLQQEYKVMVAGPSTMAALLNSLQMGFRTLAIQQNAGKVWHILGNVKAEFDKFQEVLKNAQQRITQANSELDKLIGTRTRMIQKSLKDVQTLDQPDMSLLYYEEETE